MEEGPEETLRHRGWPPGDDAHPEPYLYVGPWSPRTGPFWNEPWGASLGWEHVTDEDAAIRFLLDGLREADALG